MQALNRAKPLLELADKLSIDADIAMIGFELRLTMADAYCAIGGWKKDVRLVEEALKLLQARAYELDIQWNEYVTVLWARHFVDGSVSQLVCYVMMCKIAPSSFDKKWFEKLKGSVREIRRLSVPAGLDTSTRREYANKFRGWAESLGTGYWAKKAAEILRNEAQELPRSR
jgi:hypothetical protein